MLIKLRERREKELAFLFRGTWQDRDLNTKRVFALSGLSCSFSSISAQLCSPVQLIHAKKRKTSHYGYPKYCSKLTSSSHME